MVRTSPTASPFSLVTTFNAFGTSAFCKKSCISKECSFLLQVQRISLSKIADCVIFKFTPAKRMKQNTVPCFTKRECLSLPCHHCICNCRKQYQVRNLDEDYYRKMRKKRGIFKELYSTLHYLPPLRFQCQRMLGSNCCDLDIGSHCSARSHPERWHLNFFK